MKRKDVEIGVLVNFRQVYNTPRSQQVGRTGWIDSLPNERGLIRIRIVDPHLDTLPDYRYTPYRSAWLNTTGIVFRGRHYTADEARTIAPTPKGE